MTEPTRLANIQRTIADDLPPLSHLECDECRRRQPVTKADAGRYLSEGWPTCCGWTMRLVTVKEAMQL